MRCGWLFRRRWAHQELEYDLFGWIQSAANAVSRRPNALFRALTAGSGAARAAAAAAAGLLAVPALPATVLGTLARRGGTLVAIARRP